MYNEKLVSVIVPTYNRKNKVVQSIKSVLKQEYANLECIVVDDGSVDGTEQEVLAIKDSRLRYVRLEKNSGPSIARNEGVKESRGDYITFNDSDAYWYPNKLDKQVAYFQKHQEFGMVYCRFRYQTPEKGWLIPSLKFGKEVLEGDIYERLLEGNLVDTPAMLIKKEVLHQIGGFSESLRSLEDYDLALRIAFQYQIGFVDEVLYESVYSSNGVNSDDDNKFKAFIYLIKQNWNRTVADGRYGLLIPFLKLVAAINDKEKQDRMIEALYSLPEISSGELQTIQIIFYTFVTEIFKKEALNKIASLRNCAWQFSGRNVLIYGFGETGKVLAELFETMGIRIKGFIDQNRIFSNSYPVFSLTEIPENIDLIINTLPERQMQKKEIRACTSAEVVSVMDLGR